MSIHFKITLVFREATSMLVDSMQKDLCCNLALDNIPESKPHGYNRVGYCGKPNENILCCNYPISPSP